jgi:hypothetical protein
LRFKTQFFINSGFFYALAIFLLSLLFGIGSGEYFYRERRLIGTALLGCGWLCGLWAWWLIAGRVL